jgi:hypothetical protein
MGAPGAAPAVAEGALCQRECPLRREGEAILALDCARALTVAREKGFDMECALAIGLITALSKEDPAGPAHVLNAVRDPEVPRA